ncbi:hypothetical protein [Novosphingobium sp. BL-52-GroH]|uniref:hypothetical protein n=1 Tax=Novosphingobium sp. BL-52-GroH TaxID=3349877 RepID=UPI00384B1979
MNDDRLYRIARLVADYVRSPSLRHLRDPHFIQAISAKILKEIVHHNPTWTKWTKEREAIAKVAAFCWIPLDDFRAYLNAMPGPSLTQTDVVERLRAFNEEDYADWPDDRQQEGCLEIYKRERAEGTDMPAIVGAIETFVEQDKEARRLAQQEAHRRSVEEQRKAAEERLLSGADCKWTAIGASTTLHCRFNGRTYRLEPQPSRRLELSRVESLDDVKGDFIGSYTRRADATKTVSEMAYKSEPRWR